VQIVPAARRIGMLNDPADPRSGVDRAALLPVAAARGLTLIQGDVSTEFDAAVARLLAQKVDAILTGTAFVFNMRTRLLELAGRAGVPVAGHRSELADVGALFAYGASLAAQLRRSAHLVDKILRGAAPAEIPVEQPNVFELVINLKTARALGLAVPRSLLLRADRLIE
jgi:putative ABC transport system substrate-binding protein